jgi:hypothetical protein
MIWLRLAGDVVGWTAWLCQNRQTLEPLLQRIGGVSDLAQAAVTNPDGLLRRVGNQLVFGQADGGERVLAFIEQTTPQVESVERAVGGLQAGQVTLSSSLASLTGVSMVTLGLTALTPVVLSGQFVALNRKLSALQKQVAALQAKFDAAAQAGLETGLGLLQMGQDFLDRADRPKAHDRLNQALPLCHKAMKFYGNLLGSALNQPPVDPGEVRLLARHLSVAVAGVASCQIGLGQDQHAFGQSDPELDLLRSATRWAFHDAVARDPGPYLLPAMRAHGVTIGVMARLFQQARDAGAAEPAKDASVATWFEDHRDALVCATTREPLWSKKKWYEALRTRLLEAVAAVEETNRVLGLRRLVEEVKAAGQSTLDMMEQHKQHVTGDAGDACSYMAWGLGPEPERRADPAAHPTRTEAPKGTNRGGTEGQEANAHGPRPNS